MGKNNSGAKWEEREVPTVASNCYQLKFDSRSTFIGGSEGRNLVKKPAGNKHEAT